MNMQSSIQQPKHTNETMVQGSDGKTRCVTEPEVPKCEVGYNVICSGSVLK